MPLSLDEPDETGGARLYPKEIVNHLLLVWAIEYIEYSPTKFTKYDDEGKATTPCDAVIVDVVDLDQYDENGEAGLLARKTWWRQGRLIGMLKPRVGKPNPILVRMQRGGAAQGQSAPFEIVSMSADPASVARANKWYAANPTFTPSAVYVDDRVKQEESAVQQSLPMERMIPLPLPPERPTETPLEAAARASLTNTSTLNPDGSSVLNPAQQEVMDRLRRMSQGPQFGAPGDTDIPF
jgi:hypothetical protein